MYADSVMNDAEMGILNALPLGAYVYRLDEKDGLLFVAYNTAADEIIGIPHESFLGRPAHECFPDLERTGLVESYSRIAREGGHLHEDGVRYDDDSISGVFEVDAARYKPGFCVVLFRDVTEEVRRNKSHMEQESWLRSILAAAPIGIGVIINGQIVHANHKLCEITGYTVTDLVGADIKMLYASEDDFWRVHKAAGESVLPEPGLMTETRWQSKSGRVIDIMYSSMPLERKNPAAGESFVVVDISEQKGSLREREALRERIERSRHLEALGALAEGVGHDLNNVLGPILALPEVLQECLAQAGADGCGRLDVKQFREDLQSIHAAAGRAAEVVKDLQVLGGRSALVLKTVDLRGVVQQAWDEIRHSMDRDSRIGSLHAPCLGDEPVPVDASVHHLKRAIMNIIRNAVDAVSRHGTVDVRLRDAILTESLNGLEPIAPGAYAIIEIEDSGCGIPVELQRRIFDPFFTCQTGGRKTGSGLGLSIVRTLIKDHHGYIDVKSEAETGTLFNVYLPLSQKPVEAEERAAPRESGVVSNGIDGRGERILIAEDEPQQRFLMRRGLEKQGYQVDVAVNGEEAIEKCRKGGDSSPYDLIILDMVMQDRTDGLVAHDEILRIYPGQRIMIVSGYQPPERVRMAMGVKARWLSKPFRMEELLRIVRSVLDE